MACLHWPRNFQNGSYTRLYDPSKVKSEVEEYGVGPFLHAIFSVDRRRGCVMDWSIELEKLVKYSGIAVVFSSRSGNSV